MNIFILLFGYIIVSKKQNFESKFVVSESFWVVETIQKQGHRNEHFEIFVKYS